MKSKMIFVRPLILLIALIAFFPGNTKADCTYTYSPLSYGFSASSGTGDVTVTPSESGCAWTATSNASWITITAGSSGMGNGTISYTVAANNTGIVRRGSLTIGGQTYTIRQAKSAFTDVPADVFSPYIYSIYMENITTGCGGTSLYCPTNIVTRGQMAAFIIRAKYGEIFEYTATPYFIDVPATHVFFKYVQKLKDEGITSVTGTYNVDDTMTRGQMAAFIIRALYGESFTFTPTPYFADVPSTHIFFQYVQKMKDIGITTVTGSYDVDGMVTRAQMAAFLTRTFLEGENGFYTGITDQASINNANAEQLLLEAYNGRNMGNSIPMPLAARNMEPSSTGGYLLAMEISRLLEEATRKANVTPKAGGGLSRDALSYTVTIYGDCGGSVTSTVSVSAGGIVDGVLAFNSYCSGGTVMSGTVTFSVNNSGTLSYEFINITFICGGENFTLNGTMSAHYTASQIDVTMNMQLRYGNTGEVTWIRDFSMTTYVGSGLGYISLSWSLTFYDPECGYIIATTPVPFVFNTGNLYPSAGVLVITGRAGTAGGNTAARLTVLSSSTYHVEVDADGDGTYEWDSGEITWN